MAKGKTQTYYDNNPDAKARKKKYDTEYQKSKKQKMRRAKRNAARKKKISQGEVRKGDGKDVHHKKGVGAGNGDSNLKIESASKNRGRK